jgi:hypothetical protein
MAKKGLNQAANDTSLPLLLIFRVTFSFLNLFLACVNLLYFSLFFLKTRRSREMSKRPKTICQ